MRNTHVGTVTRFSVSLPASLARELDGMAGEKGYDNRSLAIADMIRAHLVEHRQQLGAAEIAGSITLVYDHHGHHLQDLLTDLQHEHREIIVATLHAHLDHDNCLEVLAVRGRAADIKKLADELIGAKGVKHGKLTITSNREGHGRMKLTRLALLATVLSVRVAAADTDAVVPLPEVVVTGTPIIEENGLTPLAGQFTVITEEQITELNAQDLQSALRETPGVVVTHYDPVGSFGGGAGRRRVHSRHGRVAPRCGDPIVHRWHRELQQPVDPPAAGHAQRRYCPEH